MFLHVLWFVNALYKNFHLLITNINSFRISCLCSRTTYFSYYSWSPAAYWLLLVDRTPLHLNSSHLAFTSQICGLIRFPFVLRVFHTVIYSDIRVSFHWISSSSAKAGSNIIDLETRTLSKWQLMAYGRILRVNSIIVSFWHVCSLNVGLLEIHTCR